MNINRACTALVLTSVVAFLGVESSAVAAISGGPYTGTQLGSQTLTPTANMTVIARQASIAGNADGSNTTQFTPTFGDVSARIAGNTYKAQIISPSKWALTRTGPLANGTYSGQVAILPLGFVIYVYQQAYNGSPISGSPAILDTTIIGSVGNGALTTVAMTPGPPSTWSFSLMGITSTSSGPLGGVVGSGTNGTYFGTMVLPSVTVSAP